ncbi:MAG: hypothetical protein V4538_17700 [Bacteroidota bacterium]
MTAEYPTGIFEARETENLPGILYDVDKKRDFFSEDFQNLGAEITAIETALGDYTPYGYDSFTDWIALFQDYTLSDLGDLHSALGDWWLAGFPSITDWINAVDSIATDNINLIFDTLGDLTSMPFPTFVEWITAVQTDMNTNFDFILDIIGDYGANPYSTLVEWIQSFGSSVIPPQTFVITMSGDATPGIEDYDHTLGVTPSRVEIVGRWVTDDVQSVMCEGWIDDYEAKNVGMRINDNPINWTDNFEGVRFEVGNTIGDAYQKARVYYDSTKVYFDWDEAGVLPAGFIYILVKVFA